MLIIAEMSHSKHMVEGQIAHLCTSNMIPPAVAQIDAELTDLKNVGQFESAMATSLKYNMASLDSEAAKGITVVVSILKGHIVGKCSVQ